MEPSSRFFIGGPVTSEQYSEILRICYENEWTVLDDPTGVGGYESDWFGTDWHQVEDNYGALVEFCVEHGLSYNQLIEHSEYNSSYQSVIGHPGQETQWFDCDGEGNRFWTFYELESLHKAKKSVWTEVSKRHRLDQLPKFELVESPVGGVLKI